MEIQTDQIQEVLKSLYKGLSPKKTRFITYYLETGNSAKASKEAGYKAQNGHRMMTNDDKIKKIIHLENLLMMRESQTRRFEIAHSLRDIAEKCLADNKFKDTIKCYEMEGKLLGIFDVDSNRLICELEQTVIQENTLTEDFDIEKMSRKERQEFKQIIINLNEFKKRHQEKNAKDSSKEFKAGS